MTPKLPESWRPESLLQSRAEALAKETGLPLVDAIDMLTAQTNREVDSTMANVSSKVDALLADNQRLLAALRALVDYNAEPMGGPPELWAAAREAIAKAVR